MDSRWEELKDLWKKFTWAGKITLFPFYLVVIAVLSWFELLFETVDKLGAAIVRLGSKIFFKP